MAGPSPGVQVDQATNVTFGGLLANIGGHGYLFDPIGMLSVKRLCLLMCCPDCVMPFMKYSGAKDPAFPGGERSFEFHERKSCWGIECNGCFQPPSCCKKGYYVTMKGDTTGDEGKDYHQIARTWSYGPSSDFGESYLIQDYMKNAEGEVVPNEANPRYALRSKPGCCKGDDKRKHCDNFMEGRVVINTHTTIFGRGSGGEETTAHLASMTPVGRVTKTAFLAPCTCCCAIEVGCPVNAKVEIDQTYAAEFDDDEKAKLTMLLLTMKSVDPLARVQPTSFPLPLAAFGQGALMALGWMLHMANENTTQSYSTIGEAFANGMADTGDLIPRMRAGVDAAKGAVQSATQ